MNRVSATGRKNNFSRRDEKKCIFATLIFMVEINK